MWICARRTGPVVVVLAAMGSLIAAAWAAPPAPKAVAKPKAAKGAPAPGTVAHGHELKFRPARGAAAADAKRLGALVGKECTGRAEMQRNEHQWVVLCSNGKTFVVEPAAAHQAAPPPVECSLAGAGPEQACFP